MSITNLRRLVLALAVVAPWTAQAQGRPDTAAQIAAQSEAMNALAFLDGTWRGAASTTLPSGEKHAITQTERVGTLLAGSVRVMEGRGYEANGQLSFNAFSTISYDPQSKQFQMRAHAMGHVGDFDITPTPNGFVWLIPAGPNMKIRYTAVVKDGTWSEIGERLVNDQPPIRFFEMTLKRLGDTDWPAAGVVPAN